MAKADNKMVNDLHYEGIKFHVIKKDFCKIARLNKKMMFTLMYFTMKMI